MDFYEWKYTEKRTQPMRRQILFELDHSSGHTKRDEGAIRPGSLRLNPYKEKGDSAEQLYFIL